jgi:alpha-beta hydrolase superfamily lysophospholipase
VIARLAALVSTAPARHRVRDPAGARAFSVPSGDGVLLRAAAHALPAGVRARGTVVLGHGYRDDRNQLCVIVPKLAARGLRSIAFDFRAHGESQGDRITIGVQESLDVIAMLEHARRHFDGPVFYLGFSMGAAAYLLSLQREGGAEAEAAVLDAPYDTLREAIGARFDRFLIPRALAAGLEHHGARRTGVDVAHVRPIDAMRRLQHPTRVIFAQRDAWIGPATRVRFVAAASPACDFAVVPGGHKDHLTDRWADSVADWLAARI